MIYQLPNGKIVNVSIDFFLNATEDEFNEFMYDNCYDYVEKNTSKLSMEFYTEDDEIELDIRNIKTENKNDMLNSYNEDGNIDS